MKRSRECNLLSPSELALLDAIEPTPPTPLEIPERHVTEGLLACASSSHIFDMPSASELFRPMVTSASAGDTQRKRIVTAQQQRKSSLPFLLVGHSKPTKDVVQRCPAEQAELCPVSRIVSANSDNRWSLLAVSEFLHSKESTGRPALRRQHPHAAVETLVSAFGHLAQTHLMSTSISWNLSMDEVRYLMEQCALCFFARIPTLPHRGSQTASDSALRIPQLDLVIDGETSRLHGDIPLSQLHGVKLEPTLDGAKAVEDDSLDFVRRSLVFLPSVSQGSFSQLVSSQRHHDCDDEVTFSHSVPGVVERRAVLIPTTVSELVEHAISVPTHDSLLDKFLHGGLPCGFLVDVVGAAGCGKTDLVLSWIARSIAAAVMQRRRSVQRCLIIDADGTLRVSRVQRFLYEAILAAEGSTTGGCAPFEVDSIMDQCMDAIAILRVQNLDELCAALPQVECFFLSSLGGGILLIDSISSLVEQSFLPEESLAPDPQGQQRMYHIERHDKVISVMNRLKTLAMRVAVSVLMTNQQVLKDFDASSTITDDDLVDPTHASQHIAVKASKRISAALGNTFFHAVNIRLALQRCALGGAPRLLLRIVKSPVSPPLVLELASTVVNSSTPTESSNVAMFVSHYCRLVPLELLLAADGVGKAACSIDFSALPAPPRPFMTSISNFLFPPLVLAR